MSNINSVMKEFKAFILKGNIIDMAVGVIIGGAFSKIVTSLVNDILMPLLGALTGGASFNTLKYVIHPAATINGVEVEEGAILYGRVPTSLHKKGGKRKKSPPYSMAASYKIYWIFSLSACACSL